MKYPKVEIYTEETADFEAQYICFLAKGISTGTYQDGGYLVLPELERDYPKSIHFPNLPYSKEFWRTINFCPNINLNTAYPKSAVEGVKELLRKYPNDDSQKQSLKLANDWQRIEGEFFENVAHFLKLQKSLSKVSKIKVLITPYGTRGSFNPPRVGNNFNLMVTSRVDCPAGNIASGILQNLYIIETNIGGEIGELNYYKRMAAINFIFTKTLFSKYYPGFADLTKPDFSVPRELVKKSAKYLARLGFPGKKLLALVDDKIHLNGNYTNGTFSSQETNFLRALIKNKGDVLSFDETANILWGDAADEKFSLEAMAKVVESVRRKIHNSGVHKNLINTVRGKGYILN